GFPCRCSSTLPDACPITSCMFSVSSLANAPHFSARAASSALHENSVRNSGSIDLSYASLTFDIDTDLLPTRSGTPWSLGGLIPTGVTGPESPDSTTTSMALAVIPRTPVLRYLGSHG